MTILYAGKHRLRLRLSRQEMEALRIDCEGRIDCADPDTRSALLSYLEEARSEAGFSPRGGRLLVESCLDAEGGGLITFLVPPEETGRRGMAPVIFQFDDAESLIRGAVALYERYRYRIYKSSLYSWKERYRLVLSSLDYADRLSVYFLSEFAHKLGEGEILAAFTEEHGRPIVKENAVEMLAYYFSEKESF